MARFAPSLLLTLAAALPGVAFAGSPFETVMGGADAVDISGPVDVPLYSAPWGGSKVGVFMTVGEERFFVQVLPGTSSLFLTSGAAGKLGGKVKSKEINGTEYNYTDLDEAKIGGATLRGVRVMTTQVKIDSIQKAAMGVPEDAVMFDGAIGLGALTDHLSWALLRSEGVLRLAPAGAGAGLVSDVGGETVDTQILPSEKLKFGKDKIWSVPGGMMTKANIGGQETNAVLTWAIRPSLADTELTLPEDAPTATEGDVVLRYTSAGVGGASEDTWVMHTSAFSFFTTTDGPLAPHRGVIGLDVLEELDAAYDPATGKLALKRADKPKYKDPIPELLSDAQADLDESLKPAEDAAADAEAPEGSPGAWNRVAELKRASGDLDGAVEALTKVAEMDDATCDAWLALGTAQRVAGDLDGAKTSLTKASDQFHAWWTTDIALSPKYQKLDERGIELANRKHLAAKSRDEWKEIIAKAEKKGVEPAELGVPEGLEPQPGAACAAVDAELASVLMANGDSDKVAELFAKRTDWDAKLPLIAGNAALAAGNLDGAAAAFRQSAKMDLSQDADARVGLAVVAAKTGKWDDSRKLMARATTGEQDMADVEAMLTLRAEKDGAVGAAKEAAQLSNAKPDHAGTAVVWAEWAKVAGDEGRVSEAVKRAQSGTAGVLRHDPSNAHAIALNARLAIVSGDLAAARKGAERAVKIAPHAAYTHAALAMVQAAEGDQAKADATMKKAAALAPNVPFYAMKLGKK